VETVSKPIQTLREVDLAIKDWFDKTVNARVEFPDGQLKKVPVIFSQGERWSVGRTRQAFRDENGVLILPVISVRRVSLTPDPSMSTLGVQTENFQIARRVNMKTNVLRDLETNKPNEQRLGYNPVVYDVYTMPYPDRFIGSYELVLQTQYIGQMNDLLQKIWRMMDVQSSFVAPLHNDGRHPPVVNGHTDAKPLDFPYVVGFLDVTANDSGNFEDFTDTERIIKYTTQIKVPMVLVTEPDGESATVSVHRTAYKVVIPEENVRFVDDPRELDKIFGKS
jgi:hypothetical protein